MVAGEVQKKAIVIDKVASDENIADALAKAVDATAIAKHLSAIGAEVRTDRHALAPVTEDEQSNE